MSEQFFQSNRPGYRHPVCSELENSGIRVGAGDCIVTEGRSGIRLIKPAKLYMCMQTHNKHDEDRCTAPGMHGHGSVSVSHSGTIVTRIELHTHTYKDSNLRCQCCIFAIL